MNTKVNEGKLISGKDALIALANGGDVEVKRVHDMDWQYGMCFGVSVFLSDNVKFRLKPRTISINGTEVPAPFEPKEGDIFYYLNDDYPYGYMWLRKTQDHNFKFGAWRTEEEIKQVVAALRQVFGGSHDN